MSGMPPAEALLPADSPRSMAEMAQRDLDAALQLLAFRAQYITGASGAAIALRREGRNDMLCRASTGSNAPELGALLSTEYGLSGESVRTRQLLRCDDAERDARVNREVCRRLGIASVVVMPVVSDDGVLGVFELFSGKAHAFGERDVSAVQRLSEMVETAVRLAHVAQSLPERLKADPRSPAASSEEKILDEGADAAPLAAAKAEDEQIIDVDLNDSTPAAAVGETAPVKAETALRNAIPSPAAPVPAAGAPELQTSTAENVASPSLETNKEVSASPAQKDSELSPHPAQAAVPQTQEKAPPQETPANAVASAAPVTDAPVPPKPLLWSAAEQAEAEKSADDDQSHVPPVLRGLRKCDACGFPISGGRVLCVECEEKKWRGQLKQAMPTGAIPVSAPARKPEAQAFAAAAQAGPAKSSSVPVNSPAAAPILPATKAAGPKSLNPIASQSSTSDIQPLERKPGPQLVVNNANPSPTPLFSAGIEPAGSWFSRNKYVVGALVLIAAVVAAVFLLR
jgi:GAF domain